jgi:uncharacterized protein
MTDLTADDVKKFVMASHGDLDTVKAMAEDHPELLRAQYDWGPGGLEDGIGAASHVGNRPIAEFFMAKGVPPTICTLAMLGDTAGVRAVLASDPAQSNARGAHGIPVLFHAAMSGKVELAELLVNAGCKEGFNHALHGAILFGHTDMVAWLLDHGVTDVNARDWQNKTPLEKAQETNQPAIVELLTRRQAT